MLFLSIFFLNSHLLTFLSKDIIFDPGIKVLVWLGVGDRFESWDSLSLPFSHYLEDHFFHAIENTSLFCLLFLFPLKDWFGFLSIACSLVFGFLHSHHHGVGPF